MLEIRPCCEHCGKDLAYNSTDAMICSFECTYCRDCALDLFKNVCPNCCGGFVSRPIRPQGLLPNNPVSTKKIHIPKDLEKTEIQSKKWSNINPEDR